MLSFMVYFLQQTISSCILVTHVSAPTSNGPHDPRGQRSKLKRTHVNSNNFSLVHKATEWHRIKLHFCLHIPMALPSMTF